VRYQVTTRWFLDRKHVRKKIGQGRAKALMKAGAMVFRSVRGQLLSGRPSQRGSLRAAGTFRGLPLFEVRKRKPRPGRVTSYKTPRNATGFLRTSIAFAYDPARGSVVIGPRVMESSYSRRLYRLQEKGGSTTQRLYLRNRGRPIPRQRAFGLKRTGDRSNVVYTGSFMDVRPRLPTFVATGITRTVRVRKGEYQGKGLARVFDRISQQFRNQITGP
jgi:hypothetical protein